MAEPRAKPEPCKKCQGWGQVWTCDFRDGFEYNRRWERCEACEGEGYEPQPEEEDDGEDRD